LCEKTNSVYIVIFTSAVEMIWIRSATEPNCLQRCAGSDLSRMNVTQCLRGDFWSFTFH